MVWRFAGIKRNPGGTRLEFSPGGSRRIRKASMAIDEIDSAAFLLLLWLRSKRLQ
jgi:hypothetical protein